MAPNSIRTPGIAPGRLDPPTLAENFTDLHAPLDRHEAGIEADRCYFCHDAPCMTACPTSIDIPLFIRQISTGTPLAAARTIFDQNILGGMCARVCPTETLCEEVCVRETAEGKPVKIGQLQRFATDTAMKKPSHPYQRAPETGKRVAVVGAGPAGLACAHRLAMHGHGVTLFDARTKGGGLNEFGIAAYKTVDGFAQSEVEWLLGIGGITVEYGKKLGDQIALEVLQAEYDAVFLGIGLAGVRALDVPGVDMNGVEHAVDFISDLRQSAQLDALGVGRRVVVIGGGMTAVDAAVQAKLLGAEEVTMVYRGDRRKMSASLYEQDLATTKGVRIIYGAKPIGIEGNGTVSAVDFAYSDSGETFSLAADQVLVAIGQTLDGAPPSLAIDGGKIVVSESGATSIPGVWAGGDCASGGDDLTVTAVAEGRDAAEDIHARIMASA